MARAGTITTTPHRATGAMADSGAAGLSPEESLALLLAWFSPAFPVGAFSYSHGLEAMAEAGALAGRGDAADAIDAALRHGAGWTDAVLLAHAYGAARDGDGETFDEIRALAAALSPSCERRAETLNQGEAFRAVTDAVWPGQRLIADDREGVALPVAVAAAGAARAVPLRPLAQAFLTAFAANLVSAAVRLVPLGQTDGQRLVRDLSKVAAAVARQAIAAPLDDVGGMALGLDVHSMRHEYQHVRLFRS